MSHSGWVTAADIALHGTWDDNPNRHEHLSKNERITILERRVAALEMRIDYLDQLVRNTFYDHSNPSISST